MQSNRSWREWARRWGLMGPGAQTGNLDLADQVQPVVIVDDVQAVSLPPLVRKFGWAGGLTAVALQEGILQIAPVRRPIRMLSLMVTFSAGTQDYGVNDGPYLVPATVQADPDTAARMQGPIESPAAEAGSAVIYHDAHVATGTVTARPEKLAGEATLITNVERELDLIVVPGQYFWTCNSNSNQTFTVRRCDWIEYPVDGDNQFTSWPKS